MPSIPCVCFALLFAAEGLREREGLKEEVCAHVLHPPVLLPLFFHRLCTKSLPAPPPTPARLARLLRLRLSPPP
jgi:hypothetical protein